MDQTRFFQAALWCGLLTLLFSGGLALAKQANSEAAITEPALAEHTAGKALVEPEPRIVSPANNSSHTFGNPINFLAVDDLGNCGDTAYEMIWRFKKDGAVAERIRIPGQPHTGCWGAPI